MIFHGFGDLAWLSADLALKPPEAPSGSPEAVGGRNSARGTPQSAQEPQITHRTSGSHPTSIGVPKRIYRKKYL